MRSIVSLILTVAFVSICHFVSSQFNLNFERVAIGALAFLTFHFEVVVVQHMNGEE